MDWGDRMLTRVVAVTIMVAVLLGLRPMAAAAAEVVHLTTQEWPPYQMEVGGKVEGVAVRVITCVLGRLGFVPDMTVRPWSQAQQLVRDGAADGFFASAWARTRDGFAALSAPVVPQTWMWYWRRGRGLDPDNRALHVGVQGDTAMAAWLGDHGYSHVTTTDGVSDLIGLLEAGRVDLVLANQATVDWSLGIAGETASRFSSRRHSDNGLGVYFARPFLARHPTFLARFNGEVEDCRRDAHLPLALGIAD